MASLLIIGCKPKQELVKEQTETNAYASFILEEALMDCFQPGLTFEDGRPYNCEFSAVAVMGEDLIFGNDKNIEATSPMVKGDAKLLRDGKMTEPQQVRYDEFFQIRKMEDFAFTPDGEYMFITSGFDRLKTKSNEWDAYNTLLAWNVRSDKLHIVGEVQDKGVRSSKEYRYQFLDMLESKHMKIEGLMVLPGNKLVFGVREKGEHFERPIYTTTLIEVGYQIENDRIILDHQFRIQYIMDSSSARADLGLSSLYYDDNKKKIYITTSYEAGQEGKQELGGYIWSLDLDDYYNRGKAELIKDEKGNPFLLRHKVEGITKMKDGSYFIIYDNDRTDIPVRLENGKILSRKNHQAVYSIVDLP